MQEKIIETRNCIKCNTEFEITQKDRDFLFQISPIFEGKSYVVPASELCADCSHQKRLAWRNDSKLYRGKCSATGKSIISMYSPDKQQNVYEDKVWWSDSWDPLDYGKEFDFSRPFFEQFGELISEFPYPNLIRFESENSDYTNYNGWNVDSYLCFAGNNLKDSMYCYNVDHSDTCVDCLNLTHCSKCYESINCSKSHGLFFSSSCHESSNSYFLDSCTSCQDCFLCCDLENAQYFIRNKKYSKHDYERYIQSVDIQNIKKVGEMTEEFRIFLQENSRKEKNIKGSENCTGDHIVNSKNCENCFFLREASEDCKNILMGFPALKDAQNCAYTGANSSLMYETIGAGEDSTKCIFGSMIVVGNAYLYYCYYCFRSQNCFGCTGLQGKQYCIFNKQYTKEEYEKTVPRIIEHMNITGEWGEFFPASISPFGYNETVAQDYFPLSKEESSRQNFTWSEYEAPFPKVDKVIPAHKLPEDITDIPDDILNWAIECEVTKKPFRIIRQELEFYRKHQLPIPKRHPDQRNLDRLKLRS